jgi:hypothetical protein
MSDKIKSAKPVSYIDAYLLVAWIVLWFACIWLSFIRLELFFSGLFAFILAMLFHEADRQARENSK